jgi:HIRAN domain
MKTALFVAWRNQSEIHQGWGPVGRLEHEDGIYRFFYTNGARTLLGFKPFSEMPNLDEVYESTELFPIFKNRLLAEQRPEYEKFLRWGGFSVESPPDPILILGVTEGKKATDSVEVFPCPVPDAQSCYLNKFFVHGLRWMNPASQKRIEQLKPDERLFVMPDIQNSYDENAIAIRTDHDRTMLGYVPRYLAADVSILCRSCELDFIELFVERVNLDAPLQQRLLCRMHACWPDNFRPCSGPAFQPIPSSVPADCG